jgi:tetratricopeptide (TPR) repeat protein
VCKPLTSMLLIAVLMTGCNQPSNGRPGGRGQFGPGRGLVAFRFPTDGANAEQWQEAQDAFEHGDMDRAIEALEKIIQEEPKNRQGLFLLSQALETRGLDLAHGQEKKKGYEMFRQAARHMKQLRAAVPQLTPEERHLLPTVLYNESCAEALYGQAAKALDALEDAINSGFNEFDLMATDVDLESIRGQPRYRAIVEGLRVN